MRYDNWDVIVFARDSHIPVQEFKTACYASQDEYGRQLPTLTCYIASLPASVPFRLSIHLWTGKAKPSAIIESQRRPDQRVVYTAQVIVDGVRVFHDFYEFNAWPQEIIYEKRLLGYLKHASGQPKQPLEFPPFHQNILVQSSWDAREDIGRIKLLLSEQLVSTTNSSGDPSFGATNNIVCLSFQHAPRDILEQASISWPIRNPLYLPSSGDARDRPSTLQSPWLYTPSRHPLTANHIRSPLTKTPCGTTFVRPSNPEPFARPKTDPPPQMAYFTRPAADACGRMRLTQRSGNSGDRSERTSIDDVSMDTWSTKRSTSTGTTRSNMPGLLFASPPALRNSNSFYNMPNHPVHTKSKHWKDGCPPTQGREKHMVVTLCEDQFGQLVEALSPPKSGRDSKGSQHAEHNRNVGNMNMVNVAAQAYPPKMATGLPINTKPSAAALARTASYSDLDLHTRTLSNKLSPTKPPDKNPRNIKDSPGDHMYQGSFVPKKENHVPIPFPFTDDDRDGTPYPYTPNQVEQNEATGQRPVQNDWDSDISMRNPSSVLSNLTKTERRERQGKSSLVPTPNASGHVKSKKEGHNIDNNSPVLGSTEQESRHDHSLLPDQQDSIVKSLGKSHDQGRSSDTGTTNHQYMRMESMLNTTQQDQDPFVPGHRSGADSLDSIGRVEKELFSALGEELSFNHQDETTRLYPDRTNQEIVHDSTDMTEGFLARLPEFDNSPVQKRKRNGTFGAERGRSPVTKSVREVGNSGEMSADVMKMGGA